VATCLDGFDGYLARKFGHTSEVGSKLDSEIDGFFVLVLSWIHVDQQNLEWWILIPGGIKPAYQIAFSWLPEKVKEFMPNEYRAAIGISFFLSLLVPFVTQNSFLLFLPYAFGTLVIISFITDALDRLNLVNGKDQQS